MMRFAFLVVLVVAGCEQPSPKPHPSEVPPPATSRMTTVLHDGHWWIYTNGESRYFVHHPDCPCARRRRD